jgi:hypothetical protein
VFNPRAIYLVANLNVKREMSDPSQTRITLNFGGSRLEMSHSIRRGC